MPRLNLPQKQVRSAGSTGVQPDIDISSPQFAALSNLGKRAEGLSDQAFDTGIRLQKHVDNGANASYKTSNPLFVDALNNDIQAEGLRYDKDAQNKKVADSFAERKKSLQADLSQSGVSDAAQRKIFEDLDSTQQKVNIGMRSKHIADSIELANLHLTDAGTKLIGANDIEGARELFNSREASAADNEVAFNQASKAISSENLAVLSNQVGRAPTLDDVAIMNKSSEFSHMSDKDRERYLSASKSKEDAIKLTENANVSKAAHDLSNSNRVLATIRIQNMNLLTEVDAEQENTTDEDNEYTSIHQREVLGWLDAKRKSLQKAANSTVKIAAKNALRGGRITEADFDDPNIPEEDKQLIKDFSAASQAGIGPVAPQFILSMAEGAKAMAAITILQTTDDQRKGDAAKDTRTKFKELSKDFSGVQASIDGLKEIASSDKYNYTARAQALDLYAKIKALDTVDGEWHQASTKQDLSEVEIGLYQRMQTQVSSLTRGADGSINDFEDMGLTPEAVLSLYNNIDGFVSNGMFANKTQEEADQIFEKVIQAGINRQVENSDLSKLRRFLTSSNPVLRIKSSKRNVDPSSFDTPAIRAFPTLHPFVTNEDGSKSNVKLGTFGANNKTFVIPTMVNGGWIDDDTAWMLAKQRGLHLYPSFTDEKEAQSWIKKNHGSIDERGYLKSKKEK